jgi:adenylyltransferase/sulfurtransferase
MFSKEEVLRYSRHLNLPDFDLDDQKKLRAAKVLIAGCGGLGAPIIQYLAAVGVGFLGLADHDSVDLSNLQRQTIFTSADIGNSKARAAANFVSNLNPHIKTQIITKYLDSNNAMNKISGFDMVIDGTDNLPSRYLLNDACFFAGIPLVHGSIYRYEGHISVFNYAFSKDEYSSNYRDLFPDPPPPSMVPSCAEGGVLGVLPGIVGTIMANEAIKIIRGITPALVDKLLVMDSQSLQFRHIKIKKRKDNPLTGDNPKLTKLIDYERFCQIGTLAIKEIHPEELKDWNLRKLHFTLIDVREKSEYQYSNIEGINIPLSEFDNHWREIPQHVPLVIHCQSGKRSKKAIAKLLENEWKGTVYNLRGGIEAYLSII